MDRLGVRWMDRREFIETVATVAQLALAPSPDVDPHSLREEYHEIEVRGLDGWFDVGRSDATVGVDVYTFPEYVDGAWEPVLTLELTTEQGGLCAYLSSDEAAAIAAALRRGTCRRFACEWEG